MKLAAIDKRRVKRDTRKNLGLIVDTPLIQSGWIILPEGIVEVVFIDSTIADLITKICFVLENRGLIYYVWNDRNVVLTTNKNDLIETNDLKLFVYFKDISSMMKYKLLA